MSWIAEPCFFLQANGDVWGSTILPYGVTPRLTIPAWSLFPDNPNVAGVVEFKLDHYCGADDCIPRYREIETPAPVRG